MRLVRILRWTADLREWCSGLVKPEGHQRAALARCRAPQVPPTQQQDSRGSKNPTSPKSTQNNSHSLGPSTLPKRGITRTITLRPLVIYYKIILMIRYDNPHDDARFQLCACGVIALTRRLMVWSPKCRNPSLEVSWAERSSPLSWRWGWHDQGCVLRLRTDCLCGVQTVEAPFDIGHSRGDSKSHCHVIACN